MTGPGLGLVKRGWLAAAAPRLTTGLGEPLFRLLGRRPRRHHGLDLTRAERVLVVRLDKIGDLVMSTPFFRELRRNVPAARITAVVSPGMRGVLDCCPSIDEVLTYDWRGARYLGPFRNLHALAYARRHLWPRRFDVAIVPRWDADFYHAGALSYLSGAPTRLGSWEGATPLKARANRGYDRFYTDLARDPAVRHEVEHGLDLLVHAGGTVAADHLEVRPPADAVAFATEVFRTYGVAADEPVVAFAPGAGERKKQWPVERFASVAAWASQHHRARVVLLGAPADAALGAALARAVGERVIDLVGRTSIAQTAAVLSRCDLFVGNDSGPMHLAAAAGTRVVAVYCQPVAAASLYATVPEQFAPWGVPHTLVRPANPAAPCADGCEASEAHCILGVPVDAVRDAVAEHLGAPGAASWLDHGRTHTALGTPRG